MPAATAVPAATATAAPAAPQVKAPIPYPDPNKLNIGGLEVKKQPINQIVTYKALPTYHQPAWMDDAVTKGTLPPVEKRLPKEPQVYLTSGMSDGPGNYGDLWRAFSACPIAGYNNMAGTTMGWFGIESYTVRYGSLVKIGPLFRADQDIEPFPEVAKSWEWSTDGTQLTMHLIEGAFWSDGVPFNADDVIFTWEGYIVDPNVVSPSKIDAWTWNGAATTLEKIDDYTVKFTFPIPKPLGQYYYMCDDKFFIEPAHILQALHPKWSTKNPKPSYTDFANALPPDHLPLVTLGPWVITEYHTDQLLIMRRNPYYWKVDENGNQLPYLDEIQYLKGPSGVGRDLCTMAGNCDHMNLENPSSFVQAMTAAADPAAKFSISWGPEVLGYSVEFNLSVDVGTLSDSDKAYRQLYRDVRFRQALAYATDRDGIAQAIMRGPFLRAFAGGLYPGAPDFDKTSVVYYPYDPESAKILLAEIGLKDTTGDGMLNFTSGTNSGQKVVVALNAYQDAHETETVAESLVNMWAAVGIKVNYRSLDSATNAANDTSGNWDMKVTRGGQAFMLPFTTPSFLAPTTKQFTDHREGATPRVLLDFEQQLIDIVNKYSLTFDAATRKQLLTQYNQLFTQNVYQLGVFVGRYGLGLTKRMKNVPPGTPAFMYEWVEDSILLDQLWSPADQQLKENRPNTLPVYPKA
jgi:peptide/nickel transport system substrate-binding protein